MAQQMKLSLHSMQNYMSSYFTPPTALCMNMGDFTSSSVRSNKLFASQALTDINGFAASPDCTATHLDFHAGFTSAVALFDGGSTTYS